MASATAKGFFDEPDAGPGPEPTDPDAPLAERMRPRSLDEFAGQPVVLHSGHSGVGFARFPARRLAVVVFTNLEHPAGSDPVRIVNWACAARAAYSERKAASSTASMATACDIAANGHPQGGAMTAFPGSMYRRPRSRR